MKTMTMYHKHNSLKVSITVEASHMNQPYVQLNFFLHIYNTKMSVRHVCRGEGGFHKMECLGGQTYFSQATPGHPASLLMIY